MNENIIVPPPSTLSSQIETGAGGVQTQITEKTLIRVFFVGFFFATIFFYGSKGSKHLSGGGVQLFIIIIIFFFFWGGGVQILISIETYITCDFSGGGGGVRTTYPSLDSGMGKK